MRCPYISSIVGVDVAVGVVVKQHCFYAGPTYGHHLFNANRLLSLTVSLTVSLPVCAEISICCIGVFYSLVCHFIQSNLFCRFAVSSHILPLGPFFICYRFCSFCSFRFIRSTPPIPFIVSTSSGFA